MPAIHQRPAVLLKALLVLITFAIDSGCGSIVSSFLYSHLIYAALKTKKGQEYCHLMCLMIFFNVPLRSFMNQKVQHFAA